MGGNSRETWVAVCSQPSNPALNLFKKKNLAQSWHTFKGFRSKKTPWKPYPVTVDTPGAGLLPDVCVTNRRELVNRRIYRWVREALEYQT